LDCRYECRYGDSTARIQFQPLTRVEPGLVPEPVGGGMACVVVVGDPDVDVAGTVVDAAPGVHW
jgi:hypothetical protein